MLKLYHNDMSACAQKVRFVLAAKGLEWQSEELNLRRGDQQKPEYLKINPKGLVPALVHDGNVIVESNIIADYLNEAFPEPPLLPAEPLERAQVRWWMKRLDDGLHLDLAAVSFAIAYRHQLINVCGTKEAVDRHIDGVPDPYLREVERQVVHDGIESLRFAMAIAQFDKLIRDIDEVLRTNPWISGEQLGLADIAYAPYITRLEHLCLDKLWSNSATFADWYPRLTKTNGYQSGLAQWFNADYLSLMRAKGESVQSRVAEILKT